MPKGISKKKVKAGGDIAGSGTALYATKGNKSNEFWMYSPGAFRLPPVAPRSAQASGGTVIGDWRLTIAPNPLAGGFVHLVVGGTSLSRPALVRLYDVSGRCVGVWKPLLRNGAADLDLRRLTAGVYLIAVESGDFTTTQKLVVQR